MDKATGGAAFPDPGRAQSAKQRTHLTETGMTLRDYFAAGFANAVFASTSTLLTHPTGGQEHFHKPAADIASLAYSLADAMLAERVK